MAFDRRTYMREYMKKYFQNNEEQRKKKGVGANKSHARNMHIYSKVLRHKQKGDIVSSPCIICGNEEVYGHHKDYSKPLELTWLCPLHHVQVHRGIITI